MFVIHQRFNHCVQLHIGVKVHFFYMDTMCLIIIYEKSFFSIEFTLDFLSFFDFQETDYDVSRCIFFIFILKGFYSASSGIDSLKQNWKKKSNPPFFKYLFFFQSFSIPSETPIIYLLDCIMSINSLRLCLFLTFFLSSLFFNFIIYIFLS